METLLENLSKEELISKFFEQEKSIKELNQKIESLNKNLTISEQLFESSPTPMWEEDITELIEFLDKLKLSGVSNFDEYFELNPDELKDCIAKIKLINVNKATLVLHEANSKNELKLNLDKIFTEGSIEAFKKEITAIANGVTKYEADTVAKTFRNKILYLRIYLEIISRYENGQKKYFALISTVDISKQKCDQLKIQQSEIDLRTILDASDDIALLTDVKGFILESNKACQELVGAKRIDLIGRKLNHFSPEENFSNLDNAIRKALTTKGKYNFSSDVFHKKWVCSISPLLNENNEVQKFVIFYRDITEKFKAEEKLKESEIKYKSIFDNIPLSITHIDKDGFITDINNFHIENIALGKLLKSDFIGTNVIERGTIRLAGVSENYKKLLEGVPFQLHKVFFPETSGNTEEYFDLAGTPIYLNENFVGAIVTADKVSENVLLKKAEERLAIALEGAQIGLWDQNYQTNKVWRSPEWFKMLGYKKEDFTDSLDVWKSLLHPDDLKSVLDEGDLHKKQKLEAVNVEHRMLNSKGEYQWILNWGKIIERDKDGKPLRAAGIHIDINELKQAQFREKQYLESYLGVYNNAIDAIYILDSEGKFLDVNKAAEEMYGYPKEFFIGKTPEVLSAPNMNDLDLVKSNLVKAYNGEKIEFDFWGRRSNGDIFPKIVRQNSVTYMGEKAIVAFGLDITDRYNAENELRKSNLHYKNLFNSVPIGIWEEDVSDVRSYMDELKKRGVKDLREYLNEHSNEIVNFAKRLRVIDVNKAALNLHSAKNKDDLLGNLDKIFTQNSLATFTDELISVWNEEPNFVTQGEVKTLDEEIKQIYISFSMLYDGPFAYTGIVATVDLTEKLLAEKALQESENKYRSIFENSFDGMLLTKIDGSILDVNDRVCEMFGYSKEEIILSGRELLIDTTDERLLKLLKKRKRDGKASGELRGKRKDGSIIELEVSSTLFGEDNGIPLTSMTIRDLSKQKIILKKLTETEKDLRGILDSAQDVILLLDTEGKIIEANKFALNLANTERENVIDHIIFDIIETKDVQRKRKAFRILIKRKTHEIFIDESNNRTWKMSGYPILNQNNEVSRVVVFANDITDVIEYERKLKESNIKLKKLYKYINKVREEERTSIAREIHDNLGQKLTAINLDISWIHQNLPDELINIKNQFDPILELVNNSIKAVQSISSQLRPGILDDLGLVNAIQWQANEYSSKTNLNFKLKLCDVEPELDADTKTALFRVYQEALTNVIRHSQAKNVIIKLACLGNSLLFEIIDDGIGIDNEKVSDPNSLGLIGMRERVESINGTLEIKKNMFRGTKLVISLPSGDSK